MPVRSPADTRCAVSVRGEYTRPERPATRVVECGMKEGSGSVSLPRPVMTVFHRRGRRGIAEVRRAEAWDQSRRVQAWRSVGADYRAARLVPCLLCGPLRSSASSAVRKAVTADLGSETDPLPSRRPSSILHLLSGHRTRTATRCERLIHLGIVVTIACAPQPVAVRRTRGAARSATSR